MNITMTSHDFQNVSNRRRLHCLCNRLLRRTSKKYESCALLALCEGNPPVTRNAFPCYDANIHGNIRMNQTSCGIKSLLFLSTKLLKKTKKQTKTITSSHDDVIMETCPALLALCEGNTQVIVGCQPDEPLASLVTTNRIINVYGCCYVTQLFCPSLFVFCWE